MGLNNLRFFAMLLLLLAVNKKLGAQSDKILTYEAFMEQVLAQHPIALQIGLAEQRAEFQMMQARGNMDPEMNSNWQYKQFDGKNYYNIFDAYLRIPTIIGVDAVVGYQYAQGYYINDADKLPEPGQAFLGFTLPLGQGLWNNERQTAIRQAKVLKSAAKAEIRAGINNLLFEAAKAYWDWALYYNSAQTWGQALDLAKGQFEMIKNTHLQGDIPAIDTLKAFILIQDFEIQLNDAQLMERKARWVLENYLWKDTLALQLASDVKPILFDNPITNPIDSQELSRWLENIDQHPELQLYKFQMQSLELEQRFKATKLLPKAELKYNFLATEHVDFFKNTGGISAFTEQYKLGFKFSYPILIRKERADLALNELKQKETQFKIQFKKQELSTKLRSYFNQVETYAAQVKRLDAMIANYATLLEAERSKFALGESDLLIVNTREVQYVEAQLKRYKTIAKFFESKTAWIWATASY